MPAPFLISLCGDLGAISETFIRHESEGLRSLGWNVLELDLKTGTGPENGVPFSGPVPTRTSCLLPFPSYLKTGPVPISNVWRTIAHLPVRQKVAIIRRLPLAAWMARISPRPKLLLSQFAWITADICSLVSRTTGIPWACRCHAWDIFAQPLPLLRHRLTTASAIIPCTQTAADRLVKAGLSPSKIHLVRHGISEIGACPHRVETGTGPEITVLAAGRLEPKKGFDTLIEAFAELGPVPINGMGTDPKLEIVGDGSQRACLERVARKMKRGQAPKTVRFFGACPHSEVLERMARADVFVLPSRRIESGDRDGVANVILEAMAVGVPVVTTTGGCAGEVISNGVNGLLVAPDDPMALAGAIRQLLSDSRLRSTIVANARETLVTQFSTEATVLRLSHILQGNQRAE